MQLALGLYLNVGGFNFDMHLDKDAIHVSFNSDVGMIGVGLVLWKFFLVFLIGELGEEAGFCR